MSTARPFGHAVSVAIRTLGCKVNRAESESIASDLLGRGACIVDEDEAAVVIINTCTVTREADAKVRKAVRHALSRASEPLVVVTGCLAALEPGALQQLGERVVVESDKGLVSTRVSAVLGLGAQGGGRTAATRRSGNAFRTRAMLKIEDGCDNYCTYCIVPYARGLPRAIPLVTAVEAAQELVAGGVREIVLTGINIGRYHDTETGADLAGLVEAIARTGIARLRLSSIEPPDLTERLLDVLGSTPAVCEHLHVPLQSGSDAVLSAMRRGYTAEEFAARAADAGAAIPGLALTTDVIAGFPGETAEQHAETAALIEHIAFAKVHVFRYSPRPGTPAASMPPVAAEVRAFRAAELRRLGAGLRSSYVADREGTLAEVLVEGVEGGRAVGTTRDHLRVQMTGPVVAPGEIVRWRIQPGDVLSG